MSAPVATGGKAFPALCSDHSCNEGGMSLRDWFAAYAFVTAEDPHPTLAKAVMGTEVPNFSESPITATIWWAEAEARLRYIKADAMIAARAKGGAL